MCVCVCVCVCVISCPFLGIKSVKEALYRSGKGSRRLRLPDFKTVGTRRSALRTGRPYPLGSSTRNNFLALVGTRRSALRTGRPYPLGSSTRNNFLALDPRSIVRPEGLYQFKKIQWPHRTRDLLACGAVSQPTALRRASSPGCSN
jgi:hypothetical protein